MPSIYKALPYWRNKTRKIIDFQKRISYLTIEKWNAIPLELRDKIGTIYGCDDCQLDCPFNNQAALIIEKALQQRDSIINKSLLELFVWTINDFDKYLLFEE